MIVKLLFIQRTCDYEGQYAPELYASCDEFTYDENPDYLEGKISEVQKMLLDKEITSYRVIDVKLDGSKIRELLSIPQINGTIES